MTEVRVRDAENGWIISYMEDEEIREVVFETDDFVSNECEVFKTVLYKVLDLLGPHDAKSDFSPTQIHIELRPGEELDDGSGNED